MSLDEILIRRGVVLASVLVYWGGVGVQAVRVRRHIGRSPNVRPHGARERALWLGWFAVVFGWLAMAFVVQPDSRFSLTKLQSGMVHPTTLLLGVCLIAAGYAGTLWCYNSMGDRWRMGIDHEENSALVTRGPYAVVRHPIYSFQLLMLAGAGLLLPSWLPVVVLALHLVCVWIKASDEEAHLLQVHGTEYRAYKRCTGRLLPPLLKNR